MRNTVHPRIATLSLAALTAVHTVHAQEPTDTRTVSLRTPDATYSGDFSAITSLRPLRDGRVLVLDGRANELYAVDLAAGRATMVGRQGRGPAEYQRPGGLYPAADGATVVTDRALRRHLRLSASGRIIGTEGFELPGVARAFNVGPRDDYVLDAEGRAYSERLRFVQDTPPDREGLGRDTLPLLRYSPASQRYDTIAALLGPQRYVQQQGPNVVSASTVAFSASDAFGVAADGSVAVVRAEPYRVEWIRGDGRRVVRGPTYPVPRIAVTAEERDALAARRSTAAAQSPLSGLRVNGQTMGELANASEQRVASHKPPFLASQDVVVASPTEVWVARQLPFGAEHSLYDVFDGEGRRALQVQLPPRARVLAFTADALFVVRLDDDDLPHLERYPRPSP
jgi:hypothetical protein